MPDLVVTQIIPNETEVVADAINTPNNQQADAFNAHKNGTDYRHDSSNIDVEDLTATIAAVVTASDLETVLRRYAYSFLHAVNPHAVSWAAAVMGLAADENLNDMYTLLRSHDHSDASHGGKLSQANTHQSVDTDVSAASIHHTIGTGQFQAAAGNHLHDTRYVLLTMMNAANGVAGLTAGGLLNDAQLSSNIARIVDLNALSASTTAALAGKSALGHTHGVNGEAAIVTSGIANNAVTSAQIASNAVTATHVLDGAITLNKLATDSVNSSKLQALAVGTSHLQDNAVGTAKISDNAITSVKILDAAITASKLANGIVDDTKIAAGGLNTISFKDGAITTLKLADYSVTRSKLADGAITPTTPLSLSVTILPMRKWNNLGKAVEYLGEIRDLSSYVPGPGLRRFVLIEINSTGASFVKPGDPTGGTPILPDKDADTTGLGFVYLEYGMALITSANIYPWVGPSEAGGSGSGGGSPIGHIHGMGNEARILELGLDPGFCRPTGAPSFQILISGLRYRASSGQSKFWGGGLVGPFAVPATGLTTYGVYLDPATNAPVILAGANHPTTPVSPSFVGDQRSLCYVHMRAGATYIGPSDDGVNGWIEDARTFVAGGGGASTINGVGTGGTGVASFTAGLVYSTGGNNPLTSVPAPTGTIVGTTDAQVLSNKTFVQQSAGARATSFQQIVSTTEDLITYLGYAAEGSPNFGGVSRYKTFGFGAQEATGIRRVLIGGTLTGANAAQLYIAGTVNPTAGSQTVSGVTVTPTFGATSFANVTAYGVSIGLSRTGGDTGTFVTTAALIATAAAFGTNNYAAIFTGTVAVTGAASVSAGLTVTGGINNTSGAITGAGGLNITAGASTLSGGLTVAAGFAVSSGAATFAAGATVNTAVLTANAGLNVNGAALNANAGFNAAGVVNATGANAGFQANDRGNANFALLYRVSDITYLYDNAYGNVFPIYMTGAFAGCFAHPAAVAPTMASGAWTNSSASYRRFLGTGKVQLQGTIVSTAGLGGLPSIFWTPPANFRPTGAGGWMVPIANGSGTWSWGFVYFDGTNFMVYAMGATPASGAGIQVLLNGINYSTY